ncbi:MAG: ATP synthase F1 subunit gamma [Akkermansia sp.]|nr:ATP synthase F1 subunit gamma [Akkermansia sp.]MBR3944303.1 ATP synthase F1 subunit gamma [Akkermansia sp.]
MASLRDIKRRIKSVRNTSQITKAMQMVASAKMRRAQELALKGRTYMSALANVLKHLQDTLADGASSPLMEQREKGKKLIIVVSTDRGLCGGLNSNLFKEVLLKCDADADYLTVGVKLNSQLVRAGRNLAATFCIGDTVEEAELKPIFQFIRKGFTDGTYNSVEVIYQKFVNVMVQRPEVMQLLPLSAQDLLNVAAQDDVTDDDNPNFLLEPDPKTLLNSILPLYFGHQLVQMILEGKASEQSARMVAMKAATENAKTLIGELTLEYNKARQTQITNELLEITTAMKAME